MERSRGGDGEKEENRKVGAVGRSKEMKERVWVLEREWELAERDKRKRNVIVKRVKEVKEEKQDLRKKIKQVIKGLENGGVNWKGKEIGGRKKGVGRIWFW